MHACIAFSLMDYVQLIDWSGRIIRADKKGAITETLPPILQRLDMDAQQFIYLTKHFESPFKRLVGAADKVRLACEEMGQNWVHGLRQCEKYFCSR